MEGVQRPWVHMKGDRQVHSPYGPVCTRTRIHAEEGVKGMGPHRGGEEGPGSPRGRQRAWPRFTWTAVQRGAQVHMDEDARGPRVVHTIGQH